MVLLSAQLGVCISYDVTLVTTILTSLCPLPQPPPVPAQPPPGDRATPSEASTDTVTGIEDLATPSQTCQSSLPVVVYYMSILLSCTY